MTTTSPVVIGIDSSTTACKAVAFTADGSAVAEARRSYPRSNPHPGWQEQDPREWWAALAGALAELTGLLADHDLEPIALSITHQRETFVCLDGHGQPLRPAILWLDTRAGEQIKRLGSAEVHRLSGKPPSTTPSLYKLAWIAQHEPEVLANTAVVHEVHGYLVELLTGQRVTSWATADPMSLMNLADFTWSDSLIEMAGLRRDQLPDLVAPGQVIGTVTTRAAAATGLPAGLPVVAGAGDGQCAGLGAAVHTGGNAYINLGTGITLGAHTDEYLTASAFRTLASPIAGAYTAEALLSSGALSIAWFRDALSGLPVGAGSREKQLEALARHVPAGAGGVLYLPYLTSAESPWWDADARACFVGLSDTDGTAQMYRAVLEGLAHEERLTLDLVEKAVGQPIQRVVAMGGASRSVLFTQILADILERDVAISTEVETTALGAAVLGAAAVGFTGTHDVAATAEQMSGVDTVISPRPDDLDRYRTAHEAYRQLYPALKGIFPTLAALRRQSGPAAQ
ncbi:MAG TPA: FGGY family carbohydrate kinase [Nakamurella sp.]